MSDKFVLIHSHKKYSVALTAALLKAEDLNTQKGGSVRHG